MFVIFLFLVLITKVATQCPANTTVYHSNCYSFYANSTGFAGAENICEQAGGYLASIHDGFMNALLAQEALKYFHESTDIDFWIGGTNLMKLPTWNWTDGSGFDFDDWKKGEPQNISGSNCAALSMSDGYWSSQDCYKSKPFVCQTAISFFTTPAPTTPTYPFTANCSIGWSYFPATHSCYGVNVGGLVSNWTFAENYCENDNAHLPSIHSYAEYQYLQSYVYEAWAAIWTGIYSVDGGRNWKTSDNSSTDFLNSGHWCSGSPSNNTGQRCVVLNYSCLYDEDCTVNSYRAICKQTLFQ